MKAGGRFPYEFAIGREQARYSRESSLRIYRLILLFFAGLNGVVALLAVIFRLKSTLKKEMRNIGVLKALGYRSREIMLSYALQFLLLSAAGIAVGIGCSGVFLHRLLAPVTAEAGFLWRNIFPWRDTAVWMGLLLLSVASAAGFAAGRTRRLSAAEVLSRGAQSVQGGKNFLPLESSILPLDFSMAGKMFLNGRRQNAMLILICALSVMAGSFALTLFRNIVADKEGLLQIAGAEDFSIVLRPGDGEEIDRLAQEIEALEGVQRAIKAVGPGGDVLICEGEIEARTTVYSDYEGLRRSNLCEGRYPLHDNEAAISTMLAERTGKEPGDRIRIESVWGAEEGQEEYLITGLTQGSYSGGMDVLLTMEGLRIIEPESGWGSLYLHLEPGRDTEEVIAEILQSKSRFISYIEYFQKLFEQQFSAAVFNISPSFVRTLFSRGCFAGWGSISSASSFLSDGSPCWCSLFACCLMRRLC